MLSSVILSAVIKLIWDIYSAPVAPSDNVSLVDVAAFPGSQVSATPKLYSSKLQNVFFQIEKCVCPNCKMYLSKIQNVHVQIAKYVWHLLMLYHLLVLQPSCIRHSQTSKVMVIKIIIILIWTKVMMTSKAKIILGWIKKSNDLQRGFYNKMVFASPGPIHFVWVSKAYLYSLSSRSLYLCVLDICICVRGTSVFAAWGGWDSPDTDTAASNTIWLPHLYPSIVYLSGG